MFLALTMGVKKWYWHRVFSQIKKNWLKNINKITIANSNINTLANKFSSLKKIVFYHTNILVIEEKELDETFWSGSFKIPGYKEPFRKDRNFTTGEW